MPLPRHSVALPSVQLAADAASKGVTELRVHGVGGSPPDATLGDLVPEQVMGDAIAGFYRTSDHAATQPDRDARRDVDRHVEVYSWGGLTSRSKIRVLWLALLPFLFANLAGWMCSAGTRDSAWRFRLHRLAAGLCALALTVNAALIAVMISADVNAYQTSRAGLAGHQWWLAPLNWHFVAGHAARQVTIGVLVVVLFVLALVWLASRSWRYEAVRPPYRVQNGRKGTTRKAAADTLAKGLADQEFWDGEGTVRLLTWLHVAVVGGFLAIMLGVTARALAGGSPQASVLGWTGIALGTATIALAVGYVCLDALDTPSMGTPDAKPAIGAFAEKLRGFMVYLLVPAGAGLVCSGWFAWLQPGAPSVRAADLPGMAGVTGWTALAIAVAVGIALISVLLGLRGSGGTMFGGSWVTLMLGFGSLNILLLGAEIWVAHLVGPVTSDAATALSAKPGQIYLSHVITSGVPLLVWAAVLAAVVFGAVEAVRWLRAAKLPGQMADEYEKQAAEFRATLSETPRNVWYWSGLPPFPPTGDTTKDEGAGGKWQRQIARVQFLGRAPHDAIWLLWLIIVGQLVMAACVWQLNLQPPVIVRNVGIALAGLVLPALAAFLYAAWSNPAKRRTIGVLWDVGTFWPRSYHPLCPPCYAERAVPDLQRRMWWLHDNDGRVMLVAHSQGTVLAVAALAQTACRPEGDHPALITFGSPVCKLYGWAFPAYFDHALLEPLAPGQAARVNDWRNFFYPTDPIGGSVAPELSAVGGDPVDTEFADPADCYYVYGQPPPASTGHSGYWADRRVWDVINGVAAGLPGGPDDISPERVQEIVHGPEDR
jgi:MFS family permease